MRAVEITRAAGALTEDNEGLVDCLLRGGGEGARTTATTKTTRCCDAPKCQPIVVPPLALAIQSHSHNAIAAAAIRNSSRGHHPCHRSHRGSSSPLPGSGNHPAITASSSGVRRCNSSACSSSGSSLSAGIPTEDATSRGQCPSRSARCRGMGGRWAQTKQSWTIPLGEDGSRMRRRSDHDWVPPPPPDCPCCDDHRRCHYCLDVGVGVVNDGGGRSRGGARLMRYQQAWARPFSSASLFVCVRERVG